VADGVPRMAQEKDLFDGLDLSLTGAGKGDSGAVQQRLAKVERIVEQLNRALHPTRLRPVRDGLEVCLRDLRAAMAEIDGEEEGRARKGTEGAFGTRKHEDTRRHEGTSSGPLVPSVPSAAIQAALAQKEAEASRGLALAAGLQFDALADDAWITPGQAVTVTQQLFAPDEVPIRDVSFALLLPPGWSSTETAPPSLPDGPARARAGWSVRVADTAEPSGPYWLRTPRRGDRFDWPAVAYRGEPFQPPPLRGVVELTLGQTRLRLEQPVQYRYAQPDRGEVRQEVQVVPTLGVWIEPRLRFVPCKMGRDGEGRGNWETGKLGNWGAKQGKLGNQTRPPEPNFLISQFPSATSGTSEFTLRVRNFSRTPQRGELILSVEGGSGGNPVSLPRPVKFDLNGEDAEATATVTVALPDVETPTDWVFRARARTDAGDLEPLRKMAQSGADILSASRRDVCSTDFSDRLWADTVQIIDYPHVPPRVLLWPAVGQVRILDVRVVPNLRVGYVMGTGDEVPEALEQLGVPVTLLDDAALQKGDLSAFNTIVIGVRAYEVRDALRANNACLLEWVRGGGTLIVQYNQEAFGGGAFAPYPLTISRPHDRVTVEDAPITFLQPDHPLFHVPNEIGPADFDGWVQERGLYFLHTWDARYTPLLACHDPDEEPQRGGLVVADVGRGKYVYTGYAWFRQLPAGVPGAYRLFANLVSLGHTN
jgi:hypothetical protein